MDSASALLARMDIHGKKTFHINLLARKIVNLTSCGEKMRTIARNAQFTLKAALPVNKNLSIAKHAKKIDFWTKVKTQPNQLVFSALRLMTTVILANMKHPKQGSPESASLAKQTIAGI